ncbi:MAG: hypothetical protein PHN47_07110 [Clostridia bacterium]|nr:hypothetical protein [Clostridia bacterium]
MVKRFAITLILICLLIALSSCGNSNSTGENATTVNENIIESRGFSVNSDSTEMNTLAKGTVFIKGTEGIPEQVQIIAWIEIDSNDWGGVNFYIPDN